MIRFLRRNDSRRVWPQGSFSFGFPGAFLCAGVWWAGDGFECEGRQHTVGIEPTQIIAIKKITHSELV